MPIRCVQARTLETSRKAPMIVPVILSGGSGTRLWPLSRPTQPKQLLPMVGSSTMLRSTIDRAVGLPDLAEPLVVCNVRHRHLAAAELEDAGYDPDRLVLEPIGRNTAPAVAAAADVIAASDGDDALMLVLPADHVIVDETAFRSAVSLGVPHAEAGALVTFGIVPVRPETGYGYIRTGEPVESGNRIDRFVEKPDAATAAAYVADGGYLWNSGMFLFTAGAYLEELGTHEPDMLAAVRQAVADSGTANGVVLDETAFASSPSISIDYAVMEHTKEGLVVPLDAGWNDVGSWAALHDVSPRDDEGNTAVGDIEALDTTNSYLRSSGRLVAAIGLEGMFVVDTPDAVIVGPLDRSQDVKTIVDRLSAEGRVEASEAATGIAPWGSWRRLDTTHVSALEIVVEPGQTADLTGRHELVVVRGLVATEVDETGTHISNGGEQAAVVLVVETGGDV